MTHQKSYSESRRGRYFSLPFYGYSLRQNWPTLLLLFIAFFFGVNVPLLISLGESQYNYYLFINKYSGRAKAYYEHLDELISQIGFAAIIVTALLSALLAVLSFRYENKKVDAGFWHSVPIRRQNLYINEVLVNLTYFFIAFVSSGILSMIILASKTPLRMQDGMIYIRCLLCAILIYFVTYFLVVLSSLFCGTMAARFASALTIMFLPVGIYFSCLFPFSLGETYTSWSTTVGDIAEKICFPYRVLMMYDNLFSAGEVIVYCIVSIAAFFLGMLVFVKRPTESSGVPMFFTPARSIVRYFFITMAATGLGAMLYAINDSWLIFGLVSGGVLAFIFMNALLNKSFKAMFKGFKWFIVFAAVYTLVFVGFRIDPLKLDEYVPSSFVTKTLTIVDSYDRSTPYVFTDKDDIEKIRAALKNVFDYREEDGSETASDEMAHDGPFTIYYRDNVNEISFEQYNRIAVRSDTVWGIPCEKVIYLPKRAFANLAETIKNTNEYGYGADLGKLLPDDIQHINEMSVKMWNFYCNIDVPNGIKTIIGAFENKDRPAIWYPSLGRVEFLSSFDDRNIITSKGSAAIPNDVDTVNRILEVLFRQYEKELLENKENYQDKFGEDIELLQITYGDTPLDTYVLTFMDFAEILDIATGDTVKITDKEMLKELLMSTSFSDYNKNPISGSIFERTDDRYVCFFYANETSYGYTFASGNWSGFFFENEVPAFVTKSFEK